MGKYVTGGFTLNLLIAEWAWVFMNGMGLIYWCMEGFSLQSSWQGVLLPWCGDWKQSLHKKPILVSWVQLSFLRFKLNEEPHIHKSCPSAEKLSPLKAVTFYSDWHAFSLKLWVFFHVVYCNDEKKKCTSEYVMKHMSSSLRKSDCILAFESHRVSATGYFQISGIYTSTLIVIVPRKVPIAKIRGLMPLNTSFMTKLGLKVVIIAKMIYSVKVKMCQFICNAQIHTHKYLNWYTVGCPRHSMAPSWQLRKRLP